MTLSGFWWKEANNIGVVTCLHGVAGFDKFRAQNAAGRLWHLQLLLVDVDRDLAFLVPAKGEPAPPGVFAEGVKEFAEGDTLRVVGYPQESMTQFDLTVYPIKNSVKQLFAAVGTNKAVSEALSERDSPDLNIPVAFLGGDLQPGFSGAPIVDRKGHVIAVASGGIGPSMNWVIPIADRHWSPEQTEKSTLQRLGTLDPRALFGVTMSVAPVYGHDPGLIIGGGMSQACASDGCGELEFSWAIGAYVERGVGPHFLLRAEGLYSATGSRGTIVAGSPSVPTGESYEFSVNYWDLNIVGTTGFWLGRLNTHLGFGVGMSFLASGEFILSSTSGGQTEVRPSFQSGANLIGSIGTRVGIGGKPVIPELRLVYGLRDVGVPTEDPRTERIEGKLVRYLLTVRVSI